MHLDAALPTFRLDGSITLAQASPWQTAPVTLESAALQVMTDLTQVKAATTYPSTPVREAEQQMIYLGVRMLFVVTEMPSIEGLITASDIHGDPQMRVVHERRLRFDELTVSDLMTPVARLDAIDHDALKAARVGNVVATLKRVGRDHLLVVEAATAQSAQRVRGVISRTQVERQLGQAIDIVHIAGSFSEIERALS